VIEVAHVITGLAVGGAEMMLLKLVEASSPDFRHNVISLRSSDGLGERLEQNGAKVVALNLRAGSIPGLSAVGLVTTLKQLRPHVIQGWMYHGNVAAMIAMPFLGFRPALSWSIRSSYDDRNRDTWLTRRVVRIGARLSSRVDAIIYNSQRSQRQHTEKGYAGEHAIAIPNGFDVERLRPDEARRMARRQRWRVAPDSVVVGLLARVHPIKDHATFLTAAAEVLKRNPTVVFAVAGKGVPELRTVMPSLVDAIGANLLLLPEEADVPSFMNALDICALSSRGEGFPNVLGEAMACSVPCVSTDVGDCAEIVSNTGLIVPPGSPDKLAEAILRLVTAGASERRARGELARARILSNYTLDGVARRYESVWRDLAIHRNAVARSAG
jgi:glycosyltransferase involved in cell wall biosynthesis